MFQRVMIAIDNSPQARLALKVARAHFPEAERRLLTVIDERSLPVLAPDQDTSPFAAAAQRELETLAWARESCHAVVGEKVSALLQSARAFNADLLVIGTHGRRGLNRWLSGSVAEEVIRRAGIPVLVIREASMARSEIKQTPTAKQRAASAV
jgi:nucleotide-binding universal stress UspA family protein